MPTEEKTTGWRPISEAPNRARVMAWRPSYKVACEVYVDEDEFGRRVVEPITGRTWVAEWWMPLVPPPPGQERKA